MWNPPTASLLVVMLAILLTQSLLLIMCASCLKFISLILWNWRSNFKRMLLLPLFTITLFLSRRNVCFILLLQSDLSDNPNYPIYFIRRQEHIECFVLVFDMDSDIFITSSCVTYYLDLTYSSALSYVNPTIFAVQHSFISFKIIK